MLLEVGICIINANIQAIGISVETQIPSLFLLIFNQQHKNASQVPRGFVFIEGIGN